MSKTPTMQKKYLTLLKNVKKGFDNKSLKYEQIEEIRNALCEDETFIKELKAYKDFTWEEHDGLETVLMFKKQQGYYRDKYGKKVTYNGIATLKSANTEMDLTILHKIEIQKVKDDYRYFKRLYSKIPTRNGLSRAEARQYQLDLDTAFLTGEDLVVSFSRQSGKTIGSSNFILWSSISRENSFNCGIVGNRGSTAAEVLDKIKKILVALPIWLSPNIESWNKGSIEFENGTRIMTDRPHGDAFRGFAISLLYLDEVAFYNPREWEDFKDSVFPTMSSLIKKQVIATSTAKGLNHWAAMVKGARAGKNGYKIVENSWKDVPHYNKKGRLLTNEEYRAEIVAKYGEIFFKSTEENSFMGSTVTLIDQEVLAGLGSAKPKQIPQVFHKVNIYKEVQKGHSYAMGVDPSGDGIDNFSIQVVDITSFPFVQVASASLQVDYLIMAEHLSELGKYYNNAFITIEINDGIGTSIADSLWYTYEYENIYRERNQNNKGYAKRPGFRTTQKTRPLILGTLKTFIEEDKLILNDEITINELYTFELNENGKYAASDGNKDDAVMALAISLAPFNHIKAMDDHLAFLKAVKADITEEVEGVDTSEYYSLLADDVGFSDGNEKVEERTIDPRLNQALNECGEILETQRYF